MSESSVDYKALYEEVLHDLHQEQQVRRDAEHEAFRYKVAFEILVQTLKK